MDSEDKKKVKSECETLYKLCINRKKQNFQALREWDQIRAYKLVTHRRVADQIDDALQTRVTESDQFLRVVMQFLSDRQTQQKKYQATIVTNPQSKLQANSVSRNIHITTSQCLIKLYKRTQNFKSWKKVKAVLEQGVKNIENILTESERDIMQIRTKIQLKAVQIQNENGLTIEKCDEFAAVYNKQKIIKLTQTENDLFSFQQQFLQQSIVQTKTQQSYGEAVVQLLKCVQKYEKIKLQLVRECLEKYLIALEENRQETESIKPFIDILQKRTQDQIINIFYSSEQFLSKDIIKDIKKAQLKDDSFKIDLKTIINFLTKITYHPFDSRNLVLKQYKTYLKHQSEDELQNSYIIVTVDSYLHIYQYKDQFQLLEAKPENSFKINNTIQMKRDTDIGLLVSIKKWQLINLEQPTSSKIKIVFLSQDQREEFMEFVGKIL